MNHSDDNNETIVEKSTDFKRRGLDTNIYGNRVPKKKKKTLKILLVLIMVLVVIAVGLFFLYKKQISEIDINNEDDILFYVHEGDTSDEIAENLVTAGLIRNESIFKIYSRLNNLSHFKEGQYKASKSYNLKEITEMIVKGEVYVETVIFRILEGKNIRHIAKQAKEVFDIPEKEVFDKLKDTKYIDELINEYWFLTDAIKDKRIYYPLEGYLFPDTYHFGKGATTVESIIGAMLSRTEDILEPYKQHYINEDGTVKPKPDAMPIHQVMTIASCAELEGSGEEYIKEIVGVFLNRLANGMNMGSDPTTLYAFEIDLGEKELTQKQIDTENPYNTRGPNMEEKVPVGPICSPSKLAIDATFNYKKTDNKFFVSDKNGKIYFTKTYSEHEAKIDELVNAGLWFEVED